MLRVGWISGEYNLEYLLTSITMTATMIHRIVESICYNKSVLIREKKSLSGGSRIKMWVPLSQTQVSTSHTIKNSVQSGSIRVDIQMVVSI